MQNQNKHNFSPIHLNLVEQVRNQLTKFQNLFCRQNLCSNNYLYQQMNQNFEIPFHIIAEQRKIAQISNNQQTIKQALEMCQYVQLIDNKTIRIHEYPTVKFSQKNKQILIQLRRILKQQNKKVYIYQKQQQNEIYLTLLELTPLKQLQNLIHNFDKNLQFQVADLYKDLKSGIAKIRKLKEQNKRNYKNEKYSFDKPPGIFIRRAVQSSSDQQDTNQNAKKYQSRQQKGKKDQQKQKDQKYRQKPIINQADFPSLC